MPVVRSGGSSTDNLKSRPRRDENFEFQTGFETADFKFKLRLKWKSVQHQYHYGTAHDDMI